MTSPIKDNTFNSLPELFAFARTHLSEDLLITDSKMTILTRKHQFGRPINYRWTNDRKYDVPPPLRTHNDIVAEVNDEEDRSMAELLRALIGCALLLPGNERGSAITRYIETANQRHVAENLQSLFDSIDSLNHQCAQQEGYQFTQSIDLTISVVNPSTPTVSHRWTCIDTSRGKWCSGCHEVKSTTLKIQDCSKCLIAGYCSIECQDNDRRRHDELCNSFGVEGDRADSVTSSPLPEKPPLANMNFTHLQSLLEYAEKKLSPNLVIFQQKIYIESLENRANKTVVCTPGQTTTYRITPLPNDREELIAHLKNQEDDPKAELLLGLMRPPTLGTGRKEQLIIRRYIRLLHQENEKGPLPSLHLDLNHLRQQAVQKAAHQRMEKISLTLTVLNPMAPSVLHTWTCIDTDPEKCCHGCGETKSTALKLQECARCHIASYCGEKCQKSDWKRHKPLCKPKT
jgi:hypothetical protein